MNRQDHVKPWVLPTQEPEIPPRPTRVPEVAEGAPPAKPAADLPPVDALPAGIAQDSTHAYIWRHADAAAALLRTLKEQGSDSPEEPLASFSEAQLAAAFLAGLGAEVGARVLRQLDDAHVRWAARAVAEEPAVTHATAMAALEYARRRIETGDYLEAGGQDYAVEILSRAYGESRGRWLARPEETSSGFAFLRDVAGETVAPMISHEHPQTIAIVLSQLNPHLGARIINQLPQRMQADVAYRLATMENVSPAVLHNLDVELHRSLSDMLGASQDVGGPKVVADVLNLTGSSVEKNVLDQMDAQDPEVAEAVRNMMFVFADIAKLTDREIQVLLREIDQKDLVISLKAASEELKDKILGNVEPEVRTFLCEEMEQLGPMRLTEVEEVQLRCVQQVRQLEEQGKLTIVRGDADDQFV